MERIKELDIIRGMMIIWVVMYHILLQFGVVKFGECDIWILNFITFFMHTFFFYSGYLLKTNKSLIDFTKRKIRTLLFPYFIFILFGIICYNTLSFLSSLSFSIDISSYFGLMSLRSNPPVWFLYSLFVVNIICFYIAKTNKYFKSLSLIVFLILAYYESMNNLPFGIGNILLGSATFIAGNLYKEIEPSISAYLSFLCCLFIIIMQILLPQRIEFITNTLVSGNYFICFAYCIASCHIFKKIVQTIQDKINMDIFSIAGKESIVIFGTHQPIIEVYVCYLLYILKVDSTNKILSVVLSTVILAFIETTLICFVKKCRRL